MHSRVNIIVILLVSIYLPLAKSQTSLLHSGYVNIVVVSTSDTQPTLLTENPLGMLSPVSYTLVNDSTYLFSFYTFGPTSVRLNLSNIYYPFLTLPNHKIQIRQWAEQENIFLEYAGPFKKIFDQALTIYKLTGESYQLYEPQHKVYLDANVFKNDRLNLVNEILETMRSNFESEITYEFFANSFWYFMNSFLFDYDRLIVNNNKNSGLDSVEAATHIPDRSVSYYEKLVDKRFADPSSLIGAGYHGYMQALRHERMLELPDIRISLLNYKKHLQNVFNHLFEDKDNLFYDMMVAGALSDQIADGNRLNQKQLIELTDFFTNKNITNYLLFQNQQIVGNNSIAHGNYLPFGNETKNILSNILNKYPGKIVLVDFWATWCGPCIQAFEDSKMFKESMKDNPRIHFVYVTDESSNFKQWSDYVNAVGGDHYLISTEQMKNMYEYYNFSSIPAYFLFDESSVLIDKWIGYPGNKVIKTAILNLDNTN